MLFFNRDVFQARAALKELKAREAKLESLVREGRASLAEIKHSASSNRSKGAVSKFLMQMKNSGKIPGIYGRLVRSHSSSVCLLYLPDTPRRLPWEDETAIAVVYARFATTAKTKRSKH